MLQGPNLLNNLIGILCRFRREHVAFIGDIEHMFHQFQVSPQDRDHLRFLWFKDGDCQATPTTYRMKVFLFGAICSPACANYALKSIAKYNGMYGSSNVVLGISSSSLLWELALVDNKSVPY